MSGNILPGCNVLPPMESKRPAPREKPVASKGRNQSSTKAMGGRFQTINAFVDVTLRDMRRNDIAVWLLLWRDTKSNGLAKTSQVDLARRAGVSTKSIERAVRRLTDRGLLRLIRRGGVGHGPSTYRVLGIPPDL